MMMVRDYINTAIGGGGSRIKFNYSIENNLPNSDLSSTLI